MVYVLSAVLHVYNLWLLGTFFMAHLCAQAEVGDCKEAASIFRHVALQNPQNWAAIQGFLDCMLPAESSSNSATPTNGIAHMSSLSIQSNGSMGQEQINGAAHGSDAASQVWCPVIFYMLGFIVTAVDNPPA